MRISRPSPHTPWLPLGVVLAVCLLSLVGWRVGAGRDAEPSGKRPAAPAALLAATAVRALAAPPPPAAPG
jgi:hypothetical protein